MQGQLSAAGSNNNTTGIYSKMEDKAGEPWHLFKYNLGSSPPSSPPLPPLTSIFFIVITVIITSSPVAEAGEERWPDRQI